MALGFIPLNVNLLKKWKLFSQSSSYLFLFFFCPLSNVVPYNLYSIVSKLGRRVQVHNFVAKGIIKLSFGPSLGNTREIMIVYLKVKQWYAIHERQQDGMMSNKNSHNFASLQSVKAMIEEFPLHPLLRDKGGIFVAC